MTDNNQNIHAEEEILETKYSPHDESEKTSKGGTPTSEGLLKEIEELKEALARSQADYQNLVMRNERDRADMVHFLSAKILLPLLTQIDHLERAVKIKEGVE